MARSFPLRAVVMVMLLGLAATSCGTGHEAQAPGVLQLRVVVGSSTGGCPTSIAGVLHNIAARTRSRGNNDPGPAPAPPAARYGSKGMLVPDVGDVLHTGQVVRSWCGPVHQRRPRAGRHRKSSE